MMRGRPLTEDKNTNSKYIARKLGRHVRNILRNMKNHTLRKTRTDKGVSKIVTARDRSQIQHKLHRKTAWEEQHIYLKTLCFLACQKLCEIES